MSRDYNANPILVRITTEIWVHGPVNKHELEQAIEVEYTQPHRLQADLNTFAESTDEQNLAHNGIVVEVFE